MGTTATSPSYDVVIVGGGVIGSATAYFLANNPDFNGKVLVIERDWTYAKSATALSSSSIRHQFSNKLNIEISMFGSEFVRNAGTLLEVEGEKPDLAFHENGYLYLANEEQYPVLKRNHDTQTSCGAEIELLDPAGLKQKFPWLNVDSIAGGSYGLRGEGWFDSYGLLTAFRKKARSMGVEYIENEVADVVTDGSKVIAVRLATGETIQCGQMLNSAGTRGPKIARLAGLNIPVEPRKRNLFVFECETPLQGVVPLMIDPSGVFFRQEGKYYLGGTYPKHDPEADVEDFNVLHDEFDEEVWPFLAERVPAFEAIRVVNSWAGHYDYCTLDHNAIVGPHPELRNFHFANGFSGHGLQQSPAVGRALSEMITYGQYKTLDLSLLGFERVIQNKPFLEESVI